jgi:hypothetical protein
MTRLTYLLWVPLTWASLGLAEPAPPPLSATPVWRPLQKTDDARAMTYIRFTLVGKFLGSQRDAAADRPALAIDCIPNKDSQTAKGTFLAANLLIGTPLKIAYVEPEEIHGTSYFPKVSIRYRADQGKDEQEKWSPGTDKTSVSIPKDALKRVLRAHSVEITANDDRGAQVTMQFNMPDPTSVEDACDVDYHKG